MQVPIRYGLASLLFIAPLHRILTLQEGVAGFSNSGVLTVIARYAVAEGIAQTGGLERIMKKVHGNIYEHTHRNHTRQVLGTSNQQFLRHCCECLFRSHLLLPS